MTIFFRFHPKLLFQRQFDGGLRNFELFSQATDQAWTKHGRTTIDDKAYYLPIQDTRRRRKLALPAAVASNILIFLLPYHGPTASNLHTQLFSFTHPGFVRKQGVRENNIKLFIFISQL